MALVTKRLYKCSDKNIALVSLVVEVLFCKQGVVVRFHPGAPIIVHTHSCRDEGPWTISFSPY